MLWDTNLSRSSAAAASSSVSVIQISGIYPMLAESPVRSVPELVFEGCSCERDLETVIRSAGFSCREPQLSDPLAIRALQHADRRHPYALRRAQGP
jgi:hypothetical protein